MTVTTPPRKLILKSSLSPGDIVMMTSAVRDLHKTYPGRFLTDVRTTAAELWENNPYISALNETDPDVISVDCHYPLIHKSNSHPYHFVHGYTSFLASELGIDLAPTAFKGDIHLSKLEKDWPSPVEELLGQDLPFWIIVAGGKSDFTIKWWKPSYYQEVVNRFQERILFVQVGESGHNHPPLDGVLDLRGKTNIRQLIRLVYRAQGVLCPVTFLMHLAAAVPTHPGEPKSRACVVVAGGREPSQWETYPSHRFLHTIGSLPCCETGGCWKSRTVPIGDNDPKDEPENLCLRVVEDLPECMQMITPASVCDAIESYFHGELRNYLPEKLHFGSSLKPEAPHTLSLFFPNSEPVNDTAIAFLSLRRSGTHPVIDWILSQCPGKFCFINDLNHNRSKLSENYSSDPLTGSSLDTAQPVGLRDKKQVLLISFEDERLIHVGRTPLVSAAFGKSRRYQNVLLLRDPFNMIASRLMLYRKERGNPFVENFLFHDENGIAQIANRWKFFAEEFLGATSHLGNDLITISFNQWLVDKAYRMSLANDFGLPYRDPDFTSVPRYGFGSSFDGRDYDGKNERMPVNDRWQQFVEDKEYRQLIQDEELLSYSKEIFGSTVSHEEIERVFF